jgi:hypothetical protein
MRFASRLASFGLFALILSGAAPALAQGKQKPVPRAAKAKKAPAKAPPAEQEAEAKPEAEESKTEAPAGAPEGSVKAAGTKEVKATEKETKETKAKVTAVEESEKDKGVKTYKFSAVEVEGRLKSPQIIYFLRRVRAEFEAGALGHRSFMPELSDSRRSPALK